MRKETRHAIDRRSIVKSILESFLPILRVAVPIITLNLLTTQVRDVYIPGVGVLIPAVIMRCIIIGIFAASVIQSLNTVGNRGILYELSCCFFSTEIVLFIYFIQHQVISSIIICALFALGAIFLGTRGKKQLETMLDNGYIPQALMDDIILSSKSYKPSYSLFSVALRRYLIIASALLLAIPSLLTIFVYGMDGAMQQGNSHSIIEDDAENQLILNIETLRFLDEDIWIHLNIQDKVDVLQTIADIETNYLNIEPVMVVNYHLAERTIGAYDYERRQVQIDMEKHDGDEPLEYINTILHECRHAYQHDCINSLDWSDDDIQNGIYYEQARQWRYEHENYIGISVDRDAYYNQTIEKDARYYADEGVAIYQQYIYLSNLPTR